MPNWYLVIVSRCALFLFNTWIRTEKSRLGDTNLCSTAITPRYRADGALSKRCFAKA